MKILHLISGLVFTTVLSSLTAYSQNQAVMVSENIRLSQVGFYPDAPKIAVITAEGISKFSIVTAEKQLVFSGILRESANPALNGKKTWIADFSKFNKPGRYMLYVDSLGTSFAFGINKSVYHDLAVASMKAFYYQRASTSLPEQFAGKWYRNAGHPDDKVLIHQSAISAERPEGFIISAPKGWYDAGDYNKYIVNSGITMGTLLSLCEDFPEYVKTVNTNIPESKNAVPDILDEVIWNLRWMLAMQDPNDGGVYFKLTNAKFDGMVMPETPKLPRYAVQKSTSSALDFAAVTAQASRIIKNYKKELPGLADSCLNAAARAWEWAQKNPDLQYDQNAINTKFKPEIVTGTYGDRNFADEFIWAAAELFITTGNVSYYKAVNMLPDDGMPLPSWGNVRLLGYYSLLRNEKALTGSIKEDLASIKKRMLTFADGLIAGVEDRAYMTVMGKTAREFNWGSNSTAANQGIALIQAYKLSADKKYLHYALSNLDYLLGRNATGFSYVTGIGYKTPMHPHHRPSAADGIEEPVPGLLSGGPNPGKQDNVPLPSSVPDEAFVDAQESYATNEIAINWNAPLVYLVNALEALQVKAGFSKEKLKSKK